MIKARGRTADGRDFILLGLSAENCRRLLAGQPIRVDTQAAPPAGIDLDDGPVIGVVAAETEELLAKEIGQLVRHFEN